MGIQNNYVATLLDSTSLGPYRLDTMFTQTSTSQALSLATHQPLGKNGMFELMLILNKIRDVLDKTFVIGLKYEF
jgi:hypothetical protein